MTDVDIGTVTQTSVEVSFTPSWGSESYLISANPGGIETTSTNSTAVVLSGLSSGTEYNISVVAFGRVQRDVGALPSAVSALIPIVSGL